MHKPGHYGAALLVYAPIGFLMLALEFDVLSVIGGAIAVSGAMTPDLDMRVPGIKHRGITHTVWFALVAGIVLGATGVALGSSSGAIAAVVLSAFGFLVGVLTIGAHLLADALTPMGIRPLEPIDDREISLDIAKAANPIANYVLLGLGIAAVGAAAVAGQAIA
ncbi:metal-dependent hydrolase [Natrinema hispanicum]|uniref:Inner membrane protein n=1 Tax=Natrinema hispanicum TaxID=392421 RepID=A0A1I0ITZ1_9EURY|nr:metal-dependent hydrolase [Natrinema hispanicum]SEU00757.1 inner membrane protein [Natrinema hispanicum]